MRNLLISQSDHNIFNCANAHDEFKKRWSKRINILTKFHKDWMKTTNILTKFHEDWMKTINILTKFHKDWMKTATSIINILTKFYKDWMKTLTSTVYTNKLLTDARTHNGRRTSHGHIRSPCHCELKSRFYNDPVIIVASRMVIKVFPQL
ncbi:hypothetical protein DPMN_129786 [Dreissena polymorpha]|uniref:Uncharacterized protein n=1 Tax=Dreissena polymorpha TaxID=45954 RepID=A0A9D4JNA2_DREPO|nr:hypothetical protein DPMN_118184 [Dreissena polymorpha]KAH3827843.1 hypothetical protein DPMN_129786 [Dreissena polymorpha]